MISKYTIWDTSDAFLVNPNPNHGARHKSSNETLIKRLKDVPQYRRHFVMLRLQQCIITSSVEAEHNQWKAPYIQKSRRERPSSGSAAKWVVFLPLSW